MFSLRFRTAALVLCWLVSATVATICLSSDLQNARCYTEDSRTKDALFSVINFTPGFDNGGRCSGFLVNDQYMITSYYCGYGDKVKSIEPSFQGFQASTDCSAAIKTELSIVSAPLRFTADRICQSSTSDITVYKFQPETTFFGDKYPSAYYKNLVFPTTEATTNKQMYIPQFQTDVGMLIAINDDTSSATCRITSARETSCTSKAITDFGYVCDVVEDSSASYNWGGVPIIEQSTTTVLGMHHCHNSLNSGRCSQESGIVSGTATNFFVTASDFSNCLTGCTDSAVDGVTSSCITTSSKRQTGAESAGRIASVWTRVPTGFVSPTAAHTCNFNFANVRTLDSTIYNFRGTGHYIYARTTRNANRATPCQKTNPLANNVLPLIGNPVVDADDFALSACCGTVTGFSANTNTLGPRFLLDAFQLFVNGVVFRTPNRAQGRIVNQVATFSNAPGINGVVTERSIFLDYENALPGYSVLTFLDTFTNNNLLPVSEKVILDTLLANNVVFNGFDRGALSFVTTSAGETISPDSEWLLYATPTSVGFVGILTHGPGGQKPTSIVDETMCNRGRFENGVQHAWDINLAPGQSATLMYFAVVDTAGVGNGAGAMSALAQKVAAGSVPGWAHAQRLGANVINFAAPQSQPTMAVAEFDCGGNVPVLPDRFNVAGQIPGLNLVEVLWSGLNRIGTFGGANFKIGVFDIPKFDGGFRLMVGNARYITSTDLPTVENRPRQQLRNFPPVRMSGLDVSRRIAMRNNGGSTWLRYAEMFYNPQTTPITVMVSIATTVSANEEVFTSSSGDKSLGLNDSWIVTLQNYFGNFPATAWTFRGETGTRPVRVDFSNACNGASDVQELVVTFRVTVPPQERRAIIHFADVRLVVATARQNAMSIATMDITDSPDELTGLENLSPNEIFNFAAPAAKRSIAAEQAKPAVLPEYNIKPERPHLNIKPIEKRGMTRPTLALDDVEIQVGYTSAGYGFSRIKGVAMQVGDIIVSVRETDEDPPTLEVLYDGEEYEDGQETPGAVITLDDDGERIFITLGFRNERGMKIESMPGVYLNFSPKLTGFDYANIEGLIGFWNNKAADDLRSSDRIVTSPTDQLGILQFANSWLLQGDDFDLFTLDDFTHDQFYDPTHVPNMGGLQSLRSMVGETRYQEAVAACDKIAADFLAYYNDGQFVQLIPEPNVANTPSYRRSCIRDFILSSDRRVLEAEPYGAQCPTSCSTHGRCLANGTCVCAEGYSGVLCEIGTCPMDDEGEVCSGNGRCAAGFCSCFYPFEGDLCDFERVCDRLQPPETPPKVNFTVNRQTQTVEIVVIVPFLRNLQTFLIGFTPFTTRRNVTEPLSCENYDPDIYDELDYEEFWESPPDALAPEGVGTLRYPTIPLPNEEFWSVEAIDCGTIKWTGIFSIDELAECLDLDGNQSVIKKDGRIRGSICVNRIGPVDITDPEAGFTCEQTEMEFDEEFEDFPDEPDEPDDPDFPDNPGM